MTGFTDDERRVVPRWREFGAAVSAGELRTAHGAQRAHGRERLLEKRRREWASSKDVATASELVSLAVVLERPDIAEDAAEFLAHSRDAPEMLRNSGVVLLDGHLDMQMAAQSDDRLKIAHLRGLLRRWPRNAVAWAQLALLYCRLGLNEKAQRCLNVALALGSTNRYVLRSAARFFVHRKDPGQAGYLLRESGRGEFDPWILAAEISVRHISGRPSSLVRAGSKLLASRRFLPSATAELAASLGTVEIERGSRRSARRMFELSAVEPNDNVRAQLLWLKIRHGEDVFRESVVTMGAYDHEARALAYRRTKNWKAAIQKCTDWGLDEGFSSRPFRLGSFVAIEALGDGPCAVEMANAGLQVNGGDGVLLNNLAVGLALQGKVRRAERALRSAFEASGESQNSQITLTATEGLVAYRKGEVCRGRACYAKAIRQARRDRDVWAARRAFLYMCMEELTAGTSECRLLAESATRVGSTAMVPEMEPFRARIESALAEHLEGAIVDSRQSEGPVDNRVVRRFAKAVP